MTQTGSADVAADTPLDRGAARRIAFLKAARAVFLEQGYVAASVNEVVRLAGGSLATLYSQFGSKEGLFIAVAQDQHERFAEAIMPECVDHLPLEQGLQSIGEQFMHALFAPENLAFFRVVVGEGRKFPELVQAYINASADDVRGVVIGYLRRRAPFVEDPYMAACYFLEMLRARHHYHALADDSYALSETELREHVAAAVRFLRRGMGDPSI